MKEHSGFRFQSRAFIFCTHMHIRRDVGRVPYSGKEEDAMIPFFKNHNRQFEREAQHHNQVTKEALVLMETGMQL